MTEFSFKKVWIIAKREYLERVRTRSFLLSTFVTPLLMGTFLVAALVDQHVGSPRHAFAKTSGQRES